MPTADRPNEQRETSYRNTRKQMKKHINKGPTSITGDMNARIQRAETETETKYIRNTYTFDNRNTNL